MCSKAERAGRHCRWLWWRRRADAPRCRGDLQGGGVDFEEVVTAEIEPERRLDRVAADQEGSAIGMHPWASTRERRRGAVRSFPVIPSLLSAVAAIPLQHGWLFGKFGLGAPHEKPQHVKRPPAVLYDDVFERYKEFRMVKVIASSVRKGNVSLEVDGKLYVVLTPRRTSIPARARLLPRSTCAASSTA